MNQETPICNDEFEISGSNFNFNSPTALGDQLIDMGINVFSVCNNHILDKGTEGLEAQLDYWDKKKSENSDVLTYGVYRNSEDMSNIRVKEVNGVKVAFLAYTENTNGLSLDSDSEICITYTSETDVIKEQIEAAKQISDVVIVSAHWGDEDTFTVRDSVKELAQDMVDWGADVIIGTHPHTGQTMEYLTREDGTQGFVFYSLGNFISAQTDNFNLLGQVADFDITFDATTNQASIENIKVVPVITQYDDSSLSNIRVYPYYDYTEELASQHGIVYTTSGTYRSWGMDVINEYIDMNIPSEFQCLTEIQK
jgi:poly-gamma-glutamate synthesis protein (capsule biosynthesis protein)